MNKSRILGGMQQPLIFVVSRLWSSREETLVFVTMQRHLSLSLLSSLLSLGSKLGQ